MIEYYKKTAGQTRGQAVVNYMTIGESMPTYGVHYFEVYDKRSAPWWIGLSCKGIAQYKHNDRKVPVRVFQWKQLENLYFRDKKFSIEVHDAKRVVQTLSSVNLYEDALKLEHTSASPKDELADAITDSTTQVPTFFVDVVYYEFIAVSGNGSWKKFWPLVTGCVLRAAESFLYLKLCRPAYFVKTT